MLSDSSNKFAVYEAFKRTRPVYPKPGTWVSVDRYAPGELRATALGQISLSMVSLDTPEPSFEGKPSKPNTLRLIHSTMEEMVADLRRRFGDNVSFTLADPTEDDVSLARKAVLDERFEREKQRAYRRMLTSELERYYEECASLDEAALNEEWNRNLQLFLDSEQARNIPHDFFHWPLNADGSPSFDNWVVLVRICREALVLKVPEHAAAPPHVLLDGYNYGVAHNLFHMVPQYKRSQFHLRPKAFSVENAETQDSELRAAAFKKVSAARLPAGTRIDWERAQRIGLTELEFDALRGQTTDLREADFKALQKHVRAGFRDSKPKGKS